MKQELSADLTWSLRALAQDAQTQRELYPSFVVVADELVSDFGDAYSKYAADFKEQNPDIEALDAHILSKSGIPKYWFDDAIERTEFWAEIRRLSRSVLSKRGLSVFAPHRNTNTFVSQDGLSDPVEVTDGPKRSPIKSIILKLKKLFR